MTLSETAPTKPVTPLQPRPGPAEALADLLAGNRRFAAGRPRYGHHIAEAAARSSTQEPYAVVLGCIDSRVPLEAVFDQNFGSICVVRAGGHVLDRSVVGSVEFAVTELHAPLVVVLGHERCGAVAATVEALRTGVRPDGSLGYLVEEISPAVAEVGVDDPEAVDKALRRHVQRTVEQLRAASHLAAPIAADKIQVVGAVYDLDTGVVTLL
ncbi:carbonic anhydrase 2 [Catellatospora sp. TT07R-123]|uniref:carbonic anhydrase n=1 Tax=Catellatospora sp. TT07R-123 TaxID=2733863 RepID=UPI001B2C7F37|nr:carbonic anhydrase [Catellatospora sp. TT07R-123]GHJ45153.1 carbonic anhydrase 2 [Catellatospora sp. TT07R-123]